MAEIARIGLTVGGAALFGPLGGFAGSVLGNLIFPPEAQSVDGPRADTGVTSSAHGQSIPIVLGTMRVPGQLWDAAEISEVSKTEGGGKGGGPSVTTYEYFGTFMMTIAEVPEPGRRYKLRRIWRNKKIWYDRRVFADDDVMEAPDEGGVFDAIAESLSLNEQHARSDAAAKYFTFYGGMDEDEQGEPIDQSPDPTLEGLHGVGNVPAYRGFAYCVFKDLPLADTGNQIGQWEFEVVLEGDDASLGQEYIVGKTLFPWRGGADPRHPQNEHEYIVNYNRVNEQIFSSLEEAQDAAGATGLALLGWNYADSSDEARHQDAPAGEPVYIDLLYNEAVGIGVEYVKAQGSDDPARTWMAQGNVDVGVVVYSQRYTNQASGLGMLAYGEKTYLYATGTPDENWDWIIPPPAGWEVTGETAHYRSVGGFSAVETFLLDKVVTVRRVPQYPSSNCENQPNYEIIPEAPDWCVNEKTGVIIPNLEYVPTEGDFRGLQAYAEQFDNTIFRNVVTAYPLDPVIRNNSELDTSDYWETAAATAPRLVPDVGEYPSEYPDILDEAAVAAFDYEGVVANPITLAECVRLICRLCGIESAVLQTAQLDRTLWGIALTGGTGRQNIDALRSWGFFDLVESEGQLNGVLRGGAPVMTVEADDLGAGLNNATEPLSTERTEEYELPRRVRVRYPSLNAAYQSGQQTEERQVTDSQHTFDVTVPVATTDGHAAQIAQVISREQWRSRNVRDLQLPRQYDQLEPADVFSVSYLGVAYQLRVVEKTYSAAAVVTLQVTDDASAEYTGQAVGGDILGDSDLAGLAGPTRVIPLDLPPLQDAHDSAGFYVAAWGLTSGWAGAAIEISTDGGATWQERVSLTGAATVGHVFAAVPASGSGVVDRGNEILVDLVTGELASAPEADFLDGKANTAAIGGDGHWEILSFRYAEQLASGLYRLTHLIRGRLGTEHNIGRASAGDEFVLLDAALGRVQTPPALIGTRPGIRATSFGSVPPVAHQTFPYRGLALKPLSPVLIRADRTPGGDLDIVWIRRTRVGGGWQGDPLYEEREEFEVEILESALSDAVVRTLHLVVPPNRYYLNPSIVYTAAQQTADFGDPQTAVRVRVYQVSAVVGRGFPGEAIV